MEARCFLSFLWMFCWAEQCCRFGEMFLFDFFRFCSCWAAELFSDCHAMPVRVTVEVSERLPKKLLQPILPLRK